MAMPQAIGHLETARRRRLPFPSISRRVVEAVQFMFQWLADGMSLAAAAGELNRRGYRTLHGAKRRDYAGGSPVDRPQHSQSEPSE
jgi:hypothetical protein